MHPATASNRRGNRKRMGLISSNRVSLKCEFFTNKYGKAMKEPMILTCDAPSLSHFFWLFSDVQVHRLGPQVRSRLSETMIIPHKGRTRIYSTAKRKPAPFSSSLTTIGSSKSAWSPRAGGRLISNLEKCLEIGRPAGYGRRSNRSQIRFYRKLRAARRALVTL